MRILDALLLESSEWLWPLLIAGTIIAGGASFFICSVITLFKRDWTTVSSRIWRDRVLFGGSWFGIGEAATLFLIPYLRPELVSVLWWWVSITAFLLTTFVTLGAALGLGFFAEEPLISPRRPSAKLYFFPRRIRS